MKAEMGTWEGGELLFSPLALIPLPENEIKKKKNVSMGLELRLKPALILKVVSPPRDKSTSRG